MRQVTTRTMIGAVAGLALLVTAGCGGAGTTPDARQARLAAAPIADTSDLRTITGTGTGIVRGTPDTLSLSIGVESQADSAGDALRRSNDETRKVLDVFDQAGVAKEDIQTDGLSVQPRFDDNGDKIVGYTSSNSVFVTTHNLDKAGEIIDSAAGVVGDDIRIDNVSFSIEDTSELVKTARADAVKQAREQAQQLADASGIELADIQSVEESSSPYDGRAYSASEGEVAAASPAPIEPGSAELSVSVTMVFRIA